MRQRNDQNFARALNNFANCCMSENDIYLIMSRIIGKDSIENLLLTNKSRSIISDRAIVCSEWKITI